LKISAAKGDSSFTSYYFAILNPSTNLAIGVDGDCANGANLVLQAFVDGSPHQNFQVLERQQGAEIVSIMCPNLAIGFTADDCAHGTQITLVNSPGVHWTVNGNGNGIIAVANSINCAANTVIGIDGTGSHSGRVKFNSIQNNTSSYTPSSYADIRVRPRPAKNISNGRKNSKDFKTCLDRFILLILVDTQLALNKVTVVME
jgi:hypothetical protein